ncbi:MAG: hypothetical protein JNJ69_15095 [Leptospiraceae bacterium]|nr:hypothetical protein [Leptospiraceae bacterium]
MNKKISLLMTMMLVLLVGACGTSKLRVHGDVFMEGLKAGDADKTFRMLDDSLQKEIGGADGWKKWIATRKPTQWNFHGFHVQAGGASTLKGDAVFANGQKLDVELHFIKAGEFYKVVGVNFKKDK